MTKRTIANRLASHYHQIWLSQRYGCWGGHPLPTLPPSEYLKGHYLDEIRKSQPDRYEELKEMIRIVGQMPNVEILPWKRPGKER